MPVPQPTPYGQFNSKPTENPQAAAPSEAIMDDLKKQLDSAIAELESAH
ncbi:MAG: hypothetical protein ACRYF5_00075 [Janthinobacterium lividum]